MHKLAWTLDACLRDRVLDGRRLRELAHFFSGFAAAPRPGGGRRPPEGRAAKRTRGGDDAESLGLPGRGGAGEEEPNRALGDAGMVLRDPATMHLIISQALRRLEALVAGEGSPAADADLGFMTRLLQHALGCRGMLRERAFAFAPPAPELLHTFYPLLMAAMVEAELHDADTVDGARARRPRRFFFFFAVQLLSECVEALWFSRDAASAGGLIGRADGRARPRAQRARSRTRSWSACWRATRPRGASRRCTAWSAWLPATRPLRASCSPRSRRRAADCQPPRVPLPMEVLVVCALIRASGLAPPGAPGPPEPGRAARPQALGRMSDKALPEWAPFAATLAQRLAKLAAARAVAPTDAVWGLALDHVLLRAVDTETQARPARRPARPLRAPRRQAQPARASPRRCTRRCYAC